MNDYYSTCEKQILKLIEEDELLKAQQLIDEELKMPYIPADFECLLKELRKQTLQPQEKVLSDEQIEAYLRLDEKHQILAVKALSEKNLRKYVPLIQEAFNQAKSVLVTLSLLEICIEQQLNEEFKIEKEGLEMYVIPSALTLPLDSEGLLQVFEFFKQWLENEDPSFLDLCCQCAVKEAYLRLPFEIEEDESESMALEIVYYVADLLGCVDQVESLFCEKKASQKGHFELLLYSNQI